MTEALFQKYRVEEELGRGRFGIIRRCFHKQTGEEAACKTIRKADLCDSLDRQCLDNEIKILHYISGGTAGVVDLHAVYEDTDYVHLVMEMCSGGDLHDLIVSGGRKFSEEEAATLLRMLMEAVRYCHSVGVAHRDIKPDNILFVDHSFSQIKLVDFGQASFFSSGQKMEGVVGTPYYVAPEVLRERCYDEKVDVWSAGIVGYILLSGGMPPFRGDTPQQIFEAVISGRLRFPSEPWLSISSSAKDLLRRMLCRDVDSRLTASQVLEHPWITSSSREDRGS